MKLLTAIFVIIGILAALIFVIIKSDEISKVMTIKNTMQITSSAFENNTPIPKKYTCDGEDVSPKLVWSGVPKGAQSLVLIVDDPDAPVGVFNHWLVWNIDPSVTGIEEGTSPGGTVEGTTSFERRGYGGPCPPSGEHRYFFRLYAIDAKLDIPENGDKETLEEAMVGHVLESAELVGLYHR